MGRSSVLWGVVKLTVEFASHIESANLPDMYTQNKRVYNSTGCGAQHPLPEF